ncbi:unnamed protein product [Periconia digitata]|uniref:Uncharacterized protein n=1 Tax=Periconia digitata TaxID=1303443 RepID=A0A9W4UEU9_9PLEO|nr:unnamed protein product [Periconia digitata]
MSAYDFCKPYYCIADVRCFLCQFRYDEDDLITVAGKMLQQFRFHQGEIIGLDSGEQIHMCGGSSCEIYGDTIYTFHAGCYSVAPDSFSPSFAAAITYDYRPSYDDERLRARRIRDAATAKLKNSALQQMPREIIDIITENLVLEVAAIHTKEIFSSLRFAHQFKYRLHLGKDIYVKYREIEGVDYVHWLSNTDLGGKGMRLYRARRHEKIKALWLAFDHLGVRRVCLKKHPVEISLGAGSLPYWRELRTEADEMHLSCIYDGLKLRAIKHCHGSDPIAWPRLHHEGYEAIRRSSASSIAYYGPRMTLLECQSSRVRGYCAHIALGYGEIDTLIADVHGTLGFSQEVARTYKSSSSCDWVYMPIDEGEFVEDIWIVNYKEGGTAFMFVTNWARVSMFGRMVDFEIKDSPRFLRIFSRSCGPASQLYLGDVGYHPYPSRIDCIGRDKNLKKISRNDVYNFVPQIKPEWNPYPPAITPSESKWPPFPRLEYFNKCRLEDVSHIACCVDHRHSHRPIIGIMVYYQDGRRACLGQYRHDWVVQPPLIVKNVETMPLLLTMYRDCSYEILEQGCKGIYVMKISIGGACIQSAIADGLNAKYVGKTLKIPWSGWLEWWFSNSARWNDHLFCHVAHVD